MFQTENLVYLIATAIIFFAILSSLFRLRAQIGLGAFFAHWG